MTITVSAMRRAMLSFCSIKHHATIEKTIRSPASEAALPKLPLKALDGNVTAGTGKGGLTTLDLAEHNLTRALLKLIPTADLGPAASTMKLCRIIDLIGKCDRWIVAMLTGKIADPTKCNHAMLRVQAGQGFAFLAR